MVLARGHHGATELEPQPGGGRAVGEDEGWRRHRALLDDNILAESGHRRESHDPPCAMRQPAKAGGFEAVA